MQTQGTLSMEFEPIGLKVSWIKTKFQNHCFALFDGNLNLPQLMTVQGEYVSFLTALYTLEVVLSVRDDLTRKSTDASE